MPAPTVNVTATISGQDGQPVQGATVQMVLDRSEVYQGFVVKEGAFGTTDASGTVILPVFPNELGVNGSQYRVVISTPEQTIRSTAVVPNSACNLHDIMQTPPYPPISLAQQATNQAQTYAAQASANAASASGHKDAAAASASTAGVSKTAAETARDAAVAAQAGATSARVSSETARDAAVAARDAAQAAAASVPQTGSGAAQVPTNTIADGKYAPLAHASSTSNPHGVTAAQVGAVPASAKGAANGVASLDAGGKVPASQLPPSSAGSDLYLYNEMPSLGW